MDAFTKRGSGKLFSCFRPPLVVEDSEPVSYSLQYPGDDGRRKRKAGSLRRSFSAALKAVILRSALLKKSRTEHREQDNDVFRSTLLSRGKTFVRSVKKNVSGKKNTEANDAFWSKTLKPSPFFSSNSTSPTRSSGSSTSASSRSSPARLEIDSLKKAVSLDHNFKSKIPTNKQKTMKKENCRKPKYVPTLEICVLLVCLFALIWGKVFAIVACTSAWLFFAPGRRSPKLRRGDLSQFMNSEEYKKRVIMGGLLERDRSRALQY